MFGLVLKMCFFSVGFIRAHLNTNNFVSCLCVNNFLFFITIVTRLLLILIFRLCFIMWLLNVCKLKPFCVLIQRLCENIPICCWLKCVKYYIHHPFFMIFFFNFEFYSIYVTIAHKTLLPHWFNIFLYFSAIYIDQIDQMRLFSFSLC